MPDKEIPPKAPDFLPDDIGGGTPAPVDENALIVAAKQRGYAGFNPADYTDDPDQQVYLRVLRNVGFKSVAVAAIGRSLGWAIYHAKANPRFADGVREAARIGGTQRLGAAAQSILALSTKAMNENVRFHAAVWTLEHFDENGDARLVGAAAQSAAQAALPALDEMSDEALNERAERAVRSLQAAIDRAKPSA